MQADKEEIRKVLYQIADMQTDALYNAIGKFSAEGVPDDKVPELMTKAIKDMQYCMTEATNELSKSFDKTLKEYKNGK